MSENRITSTLNKDGRLAIPKTIREMCGLKPDSEVVLIPQGGRLLVSPATPVCKKCGTELTDHVNSVEMETGMCINCLDSAVAADPKLQDQN